MQFLSRHISSLVQEAFKVSPILFLNGVRQSGKSTLVRDLAEHINANKTPVEYITFDKPTMMAAAASAPEAFLMSYDLPIIIDEAQMVPELFRALKLVVDELRLKNEKKKTGYFLLTGSANILALPKLSDALVGRMTVLTMYPFTTAEAAKNNGTGISRILKMDFKGLKSTKLSLIEAIKIATFPEISQATNEERTIWFDSYITTILQRDVRMIAELDKISLLPHLLTVLATRAGGLMNDSDIAREVGLNSVTGKTYRNILKMMFLTFDVKPWYRNIGKRLVKSPKGYLVDTCMISHLLGADLAQMASLKPALFGHLVENYVATELVKQLSNTGAKAELYHFRTSDGKEVDFILEQPDGSLIAIEVKKSELVNQDDFNGINVFKQLTGKDFKGGIVLYGGKEVVPFGEQLWAVPFSVLWE